MSHYRHGRRVRPLSSARRDAVSLAVAAAVFGVVALTATRPVLLAVPAIGGVFALAVLDRQFVASGSPRVSSGPAVAPPTLPHAYPPPWGRDFRAEHLDETMAIDMRAILEETFPIRVI